MRGSRKDSTIVRPRWVERAHPAFTLIDVLVSMVVIMVLLGLLLPTLSHVNETANRVVCRSNLRQLGMSLMMFADQHKGDMPATVFVGVRSVSGSAAVTGRYTSEQPQETMSLRLASDDSGTEGPWDGLGVLFERDVVSAAKIFYCPSHHGEHLYSQYANLFQNGGPEAIVGNFQYRGEGPLAGLYGPDAPRTNNIFKIDPAQTSLIADGMRTAVDINHRTGANFFRADQSVLWYGDSATLSDAWSGSLTPGERVDRTWNAFDTFVRMN